MPLRQWCFLFREVHADSMMVLDSGRTGSARQSARYLNLSFLICSADTSDSLLYLISPNRVRSIILSVSDRRSTLDISDIILSKSLSIRGSFQQFGVIVDVADYFGFFDGTGDTDTLYSMLSWTTDENSRLAPDYNAYFLEVILLPFQDVSFIDISFVSVCQLNELADGFMADFFKMK